MGHLTLPSYTQELATFQALGTHKRIEPNPQSHKALKHRGKDVCMAVSHASSLPPQGAGHILCPLDPGMSQLVALFLAHYQPQVQCRSKD